MEKSNEYDLALGVLKSQDKKKKKGDRKNKRVARK